MSVLHLDFETKSVVDLKKTGASVYFADPTTDVWCCAYAFDDGEVQLWTPDQPCPDEIVDHVLDGGILAAWNAAFERVAIERVLGPRYHWPIPALKQWRCVMVQAMAMALPAALKDAAPAVGLDIRKDDAGQRLMLQMARPRKRDPLTWWDDPEKLQRLYAYCRQDVVVEREIEKRLRPLKESELGLWHLDQAINSRGVYVDAELCLAAKRIVQKVEQEYDRRMLDLTDCDVTACSNRNQLITWLRGQGVDTESVAKDQLEELIAAQPPGKVRQVLELRRSSAKASVAKIDALLAGMDRDKRARGLLQFHAASTGRWAGRRFQPQNLPRPDLDLAEVRDAIAVLRSGDYDAITMIYDEPLSMIGSCLRGMISAAPGHRILAADYSNIEGRVLAWLAGEHWKLDAFRDYDNGTGHDLYKITAAGILGKKPEDITKSERQAYGKTPELACIAEGQLVLTDTGLVPIEQIKPSDKLWDGEEFVAHGGLVDRGVKDVVEYEGLIATGDHLVWIEGQHEPIHFGQAAASGARLLQSGAGRQALWVGGDHLARAQVHPWLDDALRVGALHGLQTGELGALRQFDTREEPRLPAVFDAEGGPVVARPASDGSEVEMREPGGPRLPELWGAGGGVSLLERHGGRAVRAGQPRARSGEGDRSGRQQRSLRARKSEVVDEITAEPQHPQVKAHAGRRGLGAAQKPVLRVHLAKDAADGAEPGRGDRCGAQRGPRNPEKLDGDRAETSRARVFDILNAGPRHRFTVSGKLVHNCGYQGGLGAFKTMAVNLGVNLPDDKVKEIVAGWRGKHPRIRQYWYDLEEAALAAVAEPGTIHNVQSIRFKKAGSFLFMRLPSGRFLSYVQPQIVWKDMPWLDDRTGKPARKQVLGYMGVNSYTRKWELCYAYGGLLAENCTQAVARDVMAEGMPRIEEAGYPIVLTVHDELVTEPKIGHGSLDELCALMAPQAAWAEGLPVSVAGFEAERYGKGD